MGRLFLFEKAVLTNYSIINVEVFISFRGTIVVFGKFE
jgi:hypothetical protein